jgi:chromosome segregation ATPase
LRDEPSENNSEIKIVINDTVTNNANESDSNIKTEDKISDVSDDLFDTSDCEGGVATDVASLEKQNTELLCETEGQKKVIELLRTELTKKDEDLIQIQDELASLKESSERNYRLLQNEMNKKESKMNQNGHKMNRKDEKMNQKGHEINKKMNLKMILKRLEIKILVRVNS